MVMARRIEDPIKSIRGKGRQVLLDQFPATKELCFVPCYWGNVWVYV